MTSRKRCPSGKIRNKKGKCVSRSRSIAAKKAWKARKSSMTSMSPSPIRRMGSPERRMSALSGKLTKEAIKLCREVSKNSPLSRSVEERSAKSQTTKACIKAAREGGKLRSARRRQIIENDPEGHNIAVEQALMTELDQLLAGSPSLVGVQFSPEVQYHLGILDYNTASPYTATTETATQTTQTQTQS